MWNYPNIKGRMKIELLIATHESSWRIVQKAKWEGANEGGEDLRARLHEVTREGFQNERKGGAPDLRTISEESIHC